MQIDSMLLDTKVDPFDSIDHYFEPKANGVRLQLIRKGEGSYYLRDMAPI
ncbi:hypothetical protein [Paenibacillus arenilitoris]|nr:hypothetical protein [Paenibacillus arenilitoris]